MEYEVKPVVCDYGVYKVDLGIYGVYENDELLLVLNNRDNALLIKEILESDSKHKRYINRKVIISEDEYDSLQEDGEKLNALECAGVDNWEGYGYAMDILYGEEE